MIEKSATVGFGDGSSRITLLGPRGAGLVKMASVMPEVEAFTGQIPKNDEEAYWLHVIALTASEYYGQNRNGDHWSIEGLAHLPPNWTNGRDVAQDKVCSRNVSHGSATFYGAHVFPHHCFPAGTEVLLADRRRVPIETVVPGDLVATSDGARPVGRVFTRGYKGPGLSFQLKGEPVPLMCTPDHPLLTYRRSQIHCKHGYSRVGAFMEGRKAHGRVCQDVQRPIGSAAWVRAQEVLPGDYLVLPRPEKGGTLENEHFAELVGWVASEGHLRPYGVLTFTFGERNQEDISSVCACMRANGLVPLVRPIPQHGLVSITSNSSAVGRRMAQYVQGVKSEKTLLAPVLQWDRDSKLRMLGAYIDGDGHVSRNKKNLGQLRIRSSSPSMLRLLADIIRSLGFPCTIQYDCPPREIVSPTNGKIYQGNGSGTVTVTPYYAKTLTWYSRKNKDARKMKRFRSDPRPEGFLVRVVDREEIELDEEVFNLEVPGPNDYVAGEVLVHNCNGSPAGAIGTVELVLWNPKQYWVELVVRLDKAKTAKSKVAWVLDRIARGAPFDLSMGAKVPFDMATTGDMRLYRMAQQSFDPSRHRSPADAVLELHRRRQAEDGIGIRGLSITRDDYLPECKERMGDILPGGIRVGVRNDYSRYFDISVVFVGADKVAKYVMKLASQRSGLRSYFQTPAGLGRVLLDSSDLLKAAADKDAAIKEGDIDKDVSPAFDSKSVRVLAGLEEDLPENTMARLQGHPDRAQALSTLAGLGIVLKPHEFNRIVETGEDPAVHPSLFDPSLAGALVGAMRRRSAFLPALEQRLGMAMGRGEPAGVPAPDPRYLAYRNRVNGALAEDPEGAFRRNPDLWLSLLGRGGRTPLVGPSTQAYMKHAFLPPVDGSEPSA